MNNHEKLLDFTKLVMDRDSFKDSLHNFMYELAKKHCLELVYTVVGCFGKPVANLTEMETFALLRFAGVPLAMPSMADPMSCHFTQTTVPCALQDDGDYGYIVGWQDHDGHLLTNQIALKDDWREQYDAIAGTLDKEFKK